MRGVILACENEGKWVKKGVGAIGQNNTFKNDCPIGLFSTFVSIFIKYFNQKPIGQKQVI